MNPLKQALMRLWRGRIREFLPYRVFDGGMNYEEITDYCRQVTDAYQQQGLVNPFDLYRQLVSQLGAIPNLRFVKLSALAKHSGHITVALRHDVDGDIVTAVRIAQYLHDNGLPGSLYVLHTSGYYGALSSDGLVRNRGLIGYVEAMSRTNCEFGIHSDALRLYCDFQLDGASGFLTELNWLRSVGLEVTGSVAHNSAPVYGAENFEVFKGRSFAGRESFSFNGTNVPLQVICESEHGLSYEGNFPLLKDMSRVSRLEKQLHELEGLSVRDQGWQEGYFRTNHLFSHGYECNAWLLAEDEWLFAAGSEPVKFPLTTRECVAEVGRRPLGDRVVMSIHPEYVSG